MGKIPRHRVLPAPPILFPLFPSPLPPCRASPPPRPKKDGTEMFTQDRAGWNTNAAGNELNSKQEGGEKNLCHKRNKWPEMSFPSRYHTVILSMAVSEISTCDTGGSSRKTSSRFLSLIKAGPLTIVSRSGIVALYYSLLASNYVSRADLKKSDASRSLL